MLQGVNKSADISKDSAAKENIENVLKEQQEFKYLGSKRKIPGLFLFEYNTKTHEFKQTEVNSNVVMTTDRKTQKRLSVVHNPDCIYHQAHNRRAAIKKFNKIFKRIGWPFLIEEK